MVNNVHDFFFGNQPRKYIVLLGSVFLAQALSMSLLQHAAAEVLVACSVVVSLLLIYPLKTLYDYLGRTHRINRNDAVFAQDQVPLVACPASNSDHLIELLGWIEDLKPAVKTATIVVPSLVLIGAGAWADQYPQQAQAVGASAPLTAVSVAALLVYLAWLTAMGFLHHQRIARLEGLFTAELQSIESHMRAALTKNSATMDRMLTTIEGLQRSTEAIEKSERDLKDKKKSE